MTMSNHPASTDSRPDRRLRGERGTSLIIALVFIAVFGLLLSALLTFTDTSSRATGAYRSQRSVNYATDAALDAAVNRAAHGKIDGKVIGVDPALDPTDVCNPANNATVLSRPATATAPKIVVSCRVASGSGSGQPAELGDTPPYSLLTLGDRRTDQADGTPLTATGVRNTEPAPYNGNVSTFALFSGTGDPCGNPGQEPGIRMNDKVYPWVFTILGIPISASCARFPNPDSSPPLCPSGAAEQCKWGVTGNVFSNSKILIDTPNVVPRQVPVAGGSPGTIQARGGCTGTGFGGAGSDTYCTDAGWDFSDGKGRDPGLVTPAAYAPRSISGLSVQSVPAATGCTNARRLVTFSPGIYRSAKALNDLFGNSNCKSATFWFQPGTYYFDFTNTDTSYQCGSDQSTGLYDPNVTQNTLHQWCVGGAGNDYGGQRVIGGTPYNWAPNADPTNHLITLDPAGKVGAGPGTFFGLFPQPTQFVNGDSCPGGTTSATMTDCGKTIDAKTVNYAMASNRTGSSVWLSNYPQVPRGSYTQGVDLEIAQGAINPDRMNAPTIQVDYQTTGIFGLKTTGTCGPYTLPKPPAGGAVQTIKLSAVNAAAATNLSGCLNSGDKINSAVVRYNVNRPQYQGSPYATAKLDGVRILVTAQDQPTFPRQPSETDPGGDCDSSAPGVQFIFGGDSRVYVPNGGFELCAGPNPSDQLHGQQIAIYGVPATPRLVPSSASGATNPNNAKIIAEGSGLVYASMNSGQSVALNYSGFTLPAGYTYSKIEMRTSYDAPTTAATAALQTTGGSTFSGTGCSNSVANQSGVTSGPVQSRTFDVTSCLTASNRIGSPFRVLWTAGANNAKLDGVEFMITLSPNDPNANLRPQSGCITVSPNLWYGYGSPDCAVIRVDGPVDTSGNLLGGIFGGIERRGRLSVKGTIYAPSAALDVEDQQVWYPIASRGVVARHLRIRGFKYKDGYAGAAFNNYVNTTESSRQIVFLACAKDSGPCTPDESVGRAAVAFESGTGNPAIQAWAVGKL
jgi:hypothetical protein